MPARKKLQEALLSLKSVHRLLGQMEQAAPDDLQIRRARRELADAQYLIERALRDVNHAE